MKRIASFFLVITFLTLTSCGFSGDDMKTSASGKPYDVFVVMNNRAWTGVPGDTLRSILTEELPLLNQVEPMYTVYQTGPENFKNLIQKQRNVLIYRADPYVKEASMTAEYDVYAEPQIVVRVTGPSDSVLTAYMDIHRYALQGIFEIAERERFIARATKFRDKYIQERIEKRFGLSINIPRGYNIAVETADYMWLRYELPLVEQGIVIYKYPLTSRNTFTEPYLLEKRNEFISRIPGPSEGSYMKTSSVMMPELSQLQINDRLWFASRGFWDVAGDFMGGPFTSYSTVNASDREVLTIDTYVFSPKYDKRNYVRQLEAIAYTASLPDDTGVSINLTDLEK